MHVYAIAFVISKEHFFDLLVLLLNNISELFIKLLLFPRLDDVFHNGSIEFIVPPRIKQTIGIEVKTTSWFFTFTIFQFYIFWTCCCFPNLPLYVLVTSIIHSFRHNRKVLSLVIKWKKTESNCFWARCLYCLEHIDRILFFRFSKKIVSQIDIKCCFSFRTNLQISYLNLRFTKWIVTFPYFKRNGNIVLILIYCWFLSLYS